MGKTAEIVSNPILAAATARQSELQAELEQVNKIITSMSGEAAPSKPSSGKRGRPKGSKNKPAGTPKAQRKPKAKAKSKPAKTEKASSGKRGRPKGSRNRSTNGISLIHAVASVLAEANEPMSISQIVEGVSKLGYTSNAASFNVMVSQTLGKLSEAKVAESVKRGVWQSSNGISSFLESLTTPTAEAAAAETSEPAAN